MKPRFQEPVEQTLHFLLGMVLPAVSAWREWRQWPPGQPIELATKLDGNTLRAEWWAPLDRCRDMLKDCSFALYGAQLTIVLLVGLLVWRW